MKKFSSLLLCAFILIRCAAQSYTILGSGANAINQQSYISSIAADGLGNVYAGCGYLAGGLYTGHVEKWNGTSWAELSTTDSLNGNGMVRTMMTDASNNVYAAGDFSDINVVQSGFYVAKWNGSAWSNLNTIGNPHVCNASIFSITHDLNNNIYATEFYQNFSFDTMFFYVAKWDGIRWSDLGVGSNPFHPDSLILSITTDASNNLYAAGEFGDTTGHKYVAFWNGSNWSELGGYNSLKANNYINSLTTDIHGNVYAAGIFTNNSGNKYIAKWDGSNWTDLGNSAGVLQFATSYAGYSSLCADAAGNIYAAGALKDNNGYYVAQWNGTSWYKLYTDSMISTVYVDAAQNIYGAHGGFDYIGFLPKGYVAKLNFPGASGINDVAGALSQFNIYPNPSQQEVVINGNKAISNIEIISITGQLVIAQQYNGSSAQADINIGDLAAGIYLVRIKSTDGVSEMKKLLKE